MFAGTAVVQLGVGQYARVMATEHSLRPGVLAEESVGEQEEQSEEWLRRYLNDYLTLEQAAELAGGITREGVRQRLKARGLAPRGLAETLRLRELREVTSRGSTIRDAFFSTRSEAETSAAVGLPIPTIKRYLTREVPDWKVLTRLPRNVSKRFSAQEMITSLRDATDDRRKPLTTSAYAEFVVARPALADGRPRPGVQAMILRFGSWNAAVTAAGLVANPQGGPAKEFDATDAVNAVVECWRELGQPPSAAAYDRWQVGKTGRPSAATARKLFDSWPSLQIRAWQVVHGALLDQDDEDIAVPASIDSKRPPLLGADLVEYKRADEGAAVSLPEAFEIGEYNALERAVRSHAKIQNEVAAAGARVGLVARSPVLGGPSFDVALGRSDGTVFVVEVKSATPENQELQMRLGLGQVLKYAHALRHRNDRVVPVIAIELAPEEAWHELLQTLGVGLVVAGSVEADLARITHGEQAARR